MEALYWRRHSKIEEALSKFEGTHATHKVNAKSLEHAKMMEALSKIEEALHKEGTHVT